MSNKIFQNKYVLIFSFIKIIFKYYNIAPYALKTITNYSIYW